MFRISRQNSIEFCRQKHKVIIITCFNLHSLQPLNKQLNLDFIDIWNILRRIRAFFISTTAEFHCVHYLKKKTGKYRGILKRLYHWSDELSWEIAKSTSMKHNQMLLKLFIIFPIELHWTHWQTCSIVQFANDGNLSLCKISILPATIENCIELTYCTDSTTAKKWR